MATSSGNFPRRASLIDELTRSEHYFIEDTDKCLFIGEYTSGGGPKYSQTNQLIINLKKPMNRRGLYEWRYKESAISTATVAIRNVFREEYLGRWTFVPVPPSKARSHPDYDDRMTQVLRSIRHHPPIDLRELIVQVESTKAAHETEDRPRPEQIEAGYIVDEHLTEPRPNGLMVVDDVLTTGAHFKAAQAVLSRRFPKVPIVGLFIARRAVTIDDE